MQEWLEQKKTRQGLVKHREVSVGENYLQDTIQIAKDHRQLLFLKYLLEICTESQKNEKEMYTE